LAFRNALFANCATNFFIQSGQTMIGENVTFSQGNYLGTGGSSPSGASLILTNCILANMTNISAGVITITGAYNGFYATTPFGVSTSNIPSYPFRSIGAGAFYLQTNSVC